MKNVIIVLSLVLAMSTFSQSSDKGVGWAMLSESTMAYDKQKHVVVGIYGGFAGYALACSFTENRWKRMAVGFALGTLIGTMKEASDSRSGGSGWDWADWAHTSAGSIVGGFTFDVLTGFKRRKERKAIEDFEKSLK